MRKKGDEAGGVLAVDEALADPFMEKTLEIRLQWGGEGGSMWLWWIFDQSWRCSIEAFGQFKPFRCSLSSWLCHLS